MSNARSAEWYRAQNTDISSSVLLATTDGDTTLVTGKTGWTIYVQEVRITILTSAAQTLSIEDSNATPVVINVTDSAPGAGAQYIWPCGPAGTPLTQAKNLVANVSAAGLKARIEWDGYMKQTGNEYLSSTGTGQTFAA